MEPATPGLQSLRLGGEAEKRGRVWALLTVILGLVFAALAL